MRLLLLSFITSFVALCSTSVGVLAQDPCPTPNAAPQLMVLSESNGNVSLAFATPNPNTFTDFRILVVSQLDSAVVSVQSSLSFSTTAFSGAPFMYYCITYNQTDLEALIPTVNTFLPILCGMPLAINGTELSEVFDILGQCTAIPQPLTISGASNYICLIGTFIPGATFAFGLSSSAMFTGIRALGAPLPTTVAYYANGWQLSWSAGSTAAAHTTHLQLYNMVGQMVYERTLSGATHTIEHAGLPAGTYIAHISNQQQATALQLVKQ